MENNKMIVDSADKNILVGPAKLKTATCREYSMHFQIFPASAAIHMKYKGNKTINHLD